VRIVAALLMLLIASTAAIAEPATMEAVLSRATAYVSTFTSQLSDVKCTESVLQEKITPNGKVALKEESLYDYLVTLSDSGGELMLNESRMAEREAANKKHIPLLVTNGFSMLFVVFHPYYSGSFDFSDAGVDSLGGKTVRKLHYRHLRGTHSPTAVALRGREYPLDLEGDAWVDAESGAILRMTSSIPVGIEDLGLRSMRSEVTYAPVRFRGVKEAYLLPEQAVVEVETARQHWRNTHRFSDYRQFSVSTEESVKQ
jgi:hypothetical protein